MVHLRYEQYAEGSRDRFRKLHTTTSALCTSANYTCPTFALYQCPEYGAICRPAWQQVNILVLYSSGYFQNSSRPTSVFEPAIRYPCDSPARRQTLGFPFPAADWNHLTNFRSSFSYHSPFLYTTPRPSARIAVKYSMAEK